MNASNTGAFRLFSKKFAINTIKQLTTVQYCYTLFADGREKPVTRSSGNKDRHAGDGNKRRQPERLVKESRRLRVCGQESN